MDFNLVVELSLTTKDFSMEDFVIKRAYADTSSHVICGNLTIVHISRKVEFDGDEPTIESVVYWIVDAGTMSTYAPTYMSVTCKESAYKTKVLSIDSDQIKPVMPLLTEDEAIIIRAVSDLASVRSLRGAMQQDTPCRYTALCKIAPKKFVDAVIEKCGLKRAAVPEIRHTFEEWIGIHEYIENMT
jgi:hypothetical protein